MMLNNTKDILTLKKLQELLHIGKMALYNNSTPKPEQPPYGSSGLLMLQKRRMNRKKRITNKPAGKCHAQNVINIESGSRPESHSFQM